MARRSYKSFFLFTWLSAILKACKSTNKIAVYTSTITTFCWKSLSHFINLSIHYLVVCICFCKNDLLKRFPLLLAWMAGFTQVYLGFVIGWDHRMCSPPALSPIAGTGPSPFRNIYPVITLTQRRPFWDRRIYDVEILQNVYYFHEENWVS